MFMNWWANSTAAEVQYERLRVSTFEFFHITVDI